MEKIYHPLVQLAKHLLNQIEDAGSVAQHAHLTCLRNTEVAAGLRESLLALMAASKKSGGPDISVGHCSCSAPKKQVVFVNQRCEACDAPRNQEEA